MFAINDAPRHNQNIAEVFGRYVPEITRSALIMEYSDCITEYTIRANYLQRIRSILVVRSILDCPRVR